MKMIAALGSLLVVACSHAREAEDPSSAEATSEPQANAEGQAESPAQEQTGGQPGASPEKTGRIAGGASDPNEIPVATSAAGLLKPGAEQKIRNKLGVKAGGDSLRKALQKFQKDHDLPATGILDQRTVESLGLDPDAVFERAGGR